MRETTYSFANKIIITGGATRIGAAIAEKLSGPNVKMVIHYKRELLLINRY